MTSQKLLISILILALVCCSACQRSLGKSDFRLAAGEQSRVTSSSTSTATGITDKEYVAYRQLVFEHFLNKDFAWIDREATRDRLTRDRLPGGYWKLRVLYDAMEAPLANSKASDSDWEELIAALTSWTKQQPQSVTAKVALANAWKGYAWKARGGGYAGSVSDTGRELFRRRLENASQVLSEASSLNDRCPHWFVISLWVGVGQGWDRNALEKIFQAGIKLEPTYYYIYQVKASYLLPRWGGEEGEWERFADQSTSNLGEAQGDIVFFAIYSQMLDLNGMALMNNHQHSVPKLIAGFRSIEKLYGPADHRLNEACFFASFGNDVETTADLFKRIGDNYDPGVWRSKQTFETFRSGSQERVKGSQIQKQGSQTASRNN